MTASDAERSSGFDAQAALRYVLGRQCPQGGFSFYRTPQWGVEEPNALDTYAALASLRLLHAPDPEPGRIAQWLQTLQRADGGWPNLAIAWGATLALELLGQSPQADSRPWLHGIWQRRVFARQSEEGEREWRGALGSLLQLAQLLRRLDPEFLSEGRALLQRQLDLARTAEGGWAAPGADLQTTGLAWNLAQCADLQVDHAALLAWWRRCEDPALGLRLTPQAWTTSAGALLGGLDIAQGLDVMPRYAASVFRQIGMLQQAGGGFSARHQALPTLWDTWRALSAADRLQSLNLQRRPGEPHES